MSDTVKCFLQLLHGIFSPVGMRSACNGCVKNQDQGSWVEASFQLLPVLVSS